MKVIMISGKAGSGKDTIANLIKEKLEKQNKTVLIIHFADLVKHFAYDYYNWDGQKNLEGRKLLQTIGTLVIRSKYPDYWGEIVGKFLNAIADIDHYTFQYILIPDWRFNNEFEVVSDYIKPFNNHIITIRINRYNEDGSKYINPNMTFEQTHHVSEIALDNFPFEWIIENHGTIKDLQDSIDVILEHI